DCSRGPLPLCPQAVLQRDLRRPAELRADPRCVRIRAPLVTGDRWLLSDLQRTAGEALEDANRLAQRRLQAAADVVRPATPDHGEDRRFDDVLDVRPAARLL